MGNRFKELPVSEIVVYEDNPRFIRSFTQVEAIGKIVRADKKGKELCSLAESILLYGQNPLELVGVVYDEKIGRHVAVEGNRRLTAIKLYLNPDLAGDNRAVQNAFRNLGQKYSATGTTMPESLRCCEFDTIEETNYWITLKHTGKNEGAGLVEWNRVQSKRQAIKTGTEVPDRGFQLVEWLASVNALDRVGITDYEDISNTSTLLRVINDPSVLNGFRLAFSNGVFSSFDEDFSVRCIARVIKELNTNALPVTRVYTAEDRQAYLREVTGEMTEVVGSEDTSSSVANESFEPLHDGSLGFAAGHDEPEEPDVSDNGEPDTGDTRSNAKSPGVPSLQNRSRFVMRRTGKLTNITQAKASQIYSELSKVNCDTMPVASAFLLRSIIEETGRCFHSCGIIKSQLSERQKSNLSLLMEHCINHVKSAGNEKQRNDAGRIIVIKEGQKTRIQELETLNNGVHGLNVINDKTILFTIWDKFQPFLQDLWDMMNEKNRNAQRRRK